MAVQNMDSFCGIVCTFVQTINEYPHILACIGITLFQQQKLRVIKLQLILTRARFHLKDRDNWNLASLIQSVIKNLCRRTSSPGGGHPPSKVDILTRRRTSLMSSSARGYPPPQGGYLDSFHH